MYTKTQLEQLPPFELIDIAEHSEPTEDLVKALTYQLNESMDYNKTLVSKSKYSSALTEIQAMLVEEDDLDKPINRLRTLLKYKILKKDLLKEIEEIADLLEEISTDLVGNSEYANSIINDIL